MFRYRKAALSYTMRLLAEPSGEKLRSQLGYFENGKIEKKCQLQSCRALIILHKMARQGPSINEVTL